MPINIYIYLFLEYPIKRHKKLGVTRKIGDRPIVRSSRGRSGAGRK